MAARRAGWFRPDVVPGLAVAAVGASACGWVAYVDSDPSLRIAFAGGLLMIAGGLLSAGRPGENDGVGAAPAEDEEGSEHALAREARRREHA